MKRVLRKALPAPLRLWLSSHRNAIPARDVKNVLDHEFYARTNADLAYADVNLTQHFCRHGLLEGRSPNAFFSPDYVAAQLNQDALVGQIPALTYAQSGQAQKPRLIFVSHDASRTGAPAIILRLLDMFSKSNLFECFTIFDEGGERLHEFQALSHTYQMSTSRHGQRHSDKDAFDELARLFQPNGMFQNNAPVCALVNSAESYRIGRTLARLGIPVVSLIHEIAAYYPPQVFEDIVNYSKKVIFPSHFVSGAAARYCDLDTTKTTVRGQGLLEDDFGALDKLTCRRILRENLAIEEDAFIVLNVGTMDIRKGTDMFVDIAKLFLEQSPPERPVYFLWHGAPEKEFRYAQDFVQRHDLQDKVRLMTSTPDIEQVFMGGDLFLLSARADPFPCVIHEAMACGLPVVAFRNGGGAPELIGEDCGTIVEMGDLKAAATAIRTYVETPELCEEQGRIAKQKIANNWDYHSYFQDVYKIVQDCAAIRPKSGWPPIAAPTAEPHLVVMRGCKEDLELLQNLGLDTPEAQCLIALVDGRFGADAEDVVAGLRARGLRYHVCQPTENTEVSRAIRLSGLLKNPKPGRLTLINTLQHLSDTQLKPLVFATEAVQTDNSLSLQDFYARLPYLDRLLLADEMLLSSLYQLNPNSVDIAKRLPDISTTKQDSDRDQT